MPAKKEKKPRKTKPAPPAPVADVPPPLTTDASDIGVGVPVPVVDPSEFKDPDPENPIKDILNTHGAPVGVTIIEGKNVQGGRSALVHVKSGQSSELLTDEDAKKKFVQDAEGQVYYGVHGFAIAPANTKPVDVVELAS